MLDDLIEIHQETKRRQALFVTADRLRELIENPGWVEILALEQEWIAEKEKRLLEADTADSAQALDRLRQWQLARKLLELRAGYIRKVLSDALDEAAGLTIEEALLKERTMTHELDDTAAGGDRSADRAGY